MTEASDEVGRDRERTQFTRSSERSLHRSGIIHGGEEEMTTDQEARDLARDALNRTASHERLCTERWDQQRQAMERIEAVVSEIRSTVNKRIGAVPATIISVLTALAGFLAAHAFPTH